MQANTVISRLALAAVLLLTGCSFNGSGAGLSHRTTLESQTMSASANEPTLQQYMAHEGPFTRKVSARDMTLDGRKVSCGGRPTVIDPKLDSWGGAFPGYLILNPKMMNHLPLKVKLYIYYHECGHQYVGGSETGADCYSIRQGVRQGWLDKAGMNQICAFISKLRGDAVHPPGPKRCQLMRQCYAAALRQTPQTAQNR